MKFLFELLITLSIIYIDLFILVPKDDSSSSEDDIEICPICNDKNDPNNEVGYSNN